MKLAGGSGPPIPWYAGESVSPGPASNPSILAKGPAQGGPGMVRMAFWRILAHATILASHLAWWRQSFTMTKKTVGYVKLVWTCPRCQTRNPGPNAFCNGCGAPQPEDVRFEQPAEAELLKNADEVAKAKAGPDVHCPYCGTRNRGDAKFCGACGGEIAGGKAREAGRVVGAYRPPSGKTRPCPACGTPNTLTALKCSNCGSALPGEEAPASAAGSSPVRARTPILVGGIVGALCLAAGAVLLLLSLRREERMAQVERVHWERSVAIEALGPVERSDWQDEVPADASGLTCELAHRSTEDDPAPVATEVCGTPYTVDTGSGFGEVVQDCVYEVYAPWCDYTVNEWTVVDTRRSSGEDLHPTWPDIRLGSDQRRGSQDETYTVVFVSQGEEIGR